MAKFSYIATNSTGKSSQGVVEAENQSGALEVLRKQGMRPVSVKPLRKGGIGSISIGTPKVKGKDLVIFTRQLATLVNAGVPLVRALSTLQVQTESPALGVQLEGVVKKVEAGTSLGEALSSYPKTFSMIYVNMVKAGEEGGILDEVLERLATQQEKDAALKGKIKAAMIYPSVIGVVMVGAFFILMTFIVPKIGGILTSLTSSGLPIYTRILLSISNTFKKLQFIISVAVGVPVLVIGFTRWKKTAKGRYAWHSILLKMPVIKTIIIKTAIARFSRIFGSLLGAGVSIVDTINVTAGAIGNAVIEKELRACAHAVEAGGELSGEIAKSKHFPPMVSQMLAVGEETGQTDTIILKISEFYEEEVDTAVGALSSIIEPVMIVVLGGMVGVIALSVFGPITQISSGIH